MKKTALVILSVIILCTACAAQVEEKGLPSFASIREALDSTEGYAGIVEHKDYIVLILETDGGTFRMAVLLDDHAKELYTAAQAEDYSTSAMESFNAYAWSLPLHSTEELAEMPMDQDALDRLKGKTVQELIDEGFGKDIILSENELETPSAIQLERGFYRYEFEVTNADSCDPQSMTVKSGKPNGYSRAAFEFDFHEDDPGLH